MDQKAGVPLLTRAQIQSVAYSLVIEYNGIVRAMTVPAGSEYDGEERVAAEKRAFQLIFRIVEGTMKYDGPSRWEDWM